MAKPHSSNFRVIITNVLGVRIFRNFTAFREMFIAEYYSAMFLYEYNFLDYNVFLFKES